MRRRRRRSAPQAAEAPQTTWEAREARRERSKQVFVRLFYGVLVTLTVLYGGNH